MFRFRVHSLHMFILQADIIVNVYEYNMDRIGPNGENTLEVFFIGPINNRPRSITKKMRFMYINGFNLEACQI